MRSAVRSGAQHGPKARSGTHPRAHLVDGEVEGLVIHVLAQVQVDLEGPCQPLQGGGNA